MSFGSLFQEVGNGYTEPKNLLTFCSSFLLSSTYPNMHKTFFCPHAEPSSIQTTTFMPFLDRMMPVYQQTEFLFNSCTFMAQHSLVPSPHVSKHNLCVTREVSSLKLRVPCNMCCSLQASRCG